MSYDVDRLAESLVDVNFGMPDAVGTVKRNKIQSVVEPIENSIERIT